MIPRQAEMCTVWLITEACVVSKAIQDLSMDGAVGGFDN